MSRAQQRGLQQDSAVWRPQQAEEAAPRPNSGACPAACGVAFGVRDDQDAGSPSTCLQNASRDQLAGPRAPGRRRSRPLLRDPVQDDEVSQAFLGA